jgi:hypothetical protein
MKKKTPKERDVTPKTNLPVMGRPTKYKPEYCQMLIKHMSQGYSYETFGAIVDVDRDTLYHWEKLFKDFSDAKRKAFLKCQHFWEKQGIDCLITPKGITFASSSWIFNMKARFKWKDGNEEKKEEESKKDVSFVAEWGNKKES